jgi:phosphoglycerol transferase MdoB-like AlkP superfamily enzyme
LSGEKNTVSTTTNTFVVPPQIITLTRSSNAIGGEISAVPEEVTMVLGVLSLLVAVTCFILFLSLLTMKRLKKTTMMLSLLSIAILLLSLIVFFYAFSQLTQVGVGSFMGSGNLDVTLPGEVEQTTIACSWSPGIGFYLLIPSLILLVLTLFIKRIEKKFIRKE